MIRDRTRRIVVFTYQDSRRAWSRWRLGGCKMRKVMGPICFSDELFRDAMRRAHDNLMPVVRRED
jgi:hypothetical protein